MATDLMNAHPDLTGLVGECSSSAPGVAQAVQDAGKIGKVFTVGMGTPHDEAVPGRRIGVGRRALGRENLGYLTAWTGAQLAEGKPFRRRTRSPTRTGAVTYDAATKTLLLGPPLAITKDNVDEFNY